MSDGKGADPEIAAIATVYDGVRSLEKEAQQRVLDYVATKLGLLRTSTAPERPQGQGHSESARVSAASAVSDSPTEAHEDNPELDGISATAQKWMRRAGLDAARLSKIFSLGVDEIDFVGPSVPGKDKKSRTRQITLLKGIAEYLRSGVPRIAYESIREACTHYDAYDQSNFAGYIKSFSAEISGSRESGFTLTARGLTAATELVKQLTE